MNKMMIAAFCAALCVAMSGCGTPPKLNDAAAKGMYVNAATETMAIGYGKITSIPGEREAFAGHYSEDTALLSPSTKTHSFDIFIVGSNATSQATAVVNAVCKSFGIVAPVISSNECAKSGITVFDLFKAKKAEKKDQKNFEGWLKDTKKAMDKSSADMKDFYADIIFFATNRNVKVEAK